MEVNKQYLTELFNDFHNAHLVDITNITKVKRGEKGFPGFLIHYKYKESSGVKGRNHYHIYESKLRDYKLKKILPDD